MKDLLDRVVEKIDMTGECWVWTGSISHGYGRVRTPEGVRQAHRVVYEMFVGPIPDGLDLDHLCCVKECVHPDHVEPVTHRENVTRGAGWAAVNAAVTHCKNGHPYDEANTYLWRGSRHCRACNAARKAHP